MADLFERTNQPHIDVSDTFRIHSIYTAFERHYDYNYVFRGERHDFWELVIVIDGQIGVTAENDVLTLTKGQAFLHEPMEFHRLWNAENLETTIIVFTFRAEHMPTYTSRLFEIDIPTARNVLRRIKSAYEFQARNIVAIKENSYAKSQIALKHLEMFVLETLTSQSELSEISVSRSMKNYTAIVNVLENNINKNLSVSDIASICNMSEIHLKQTFSRYAGMGVKNYFNRLKVNAAISMLRDGATVQEVSDSLGFSSQNYFSTVFKRITGHVPTYYK